MRQLLLLVALALPIGCEAQDFPRTSLSIGVHLIQAEVAATQEMRARGLMYREKLGQNEGMVFRFPAPRQICMWMKNTLIPLSVAFIDESGIIINIEDMQPHTRDPHNAKKPVRYALEMNQGWFRKRGIGPGARVEGLERAPPPR